MKHDKKNFPLLKFRTVSPISGDSKLSITQPAHNLSHISSIITSIFNTINCIIHSRICSGPYSFPNFILHHTHKIKIKKANLHMKISHIDTYIHIHRKIHSLIFEENEVNQTAIKITEEVTQCVRPLRTILSSL